MVHVNFDRDFSISCEDYKIDGKDWYHYFLCGYKVWRNLWFIYLEQFTLITYNGLFQKISTRLPQRVVFSVSHPPIPMEILNLFHTCLLKLA